MQQEARVLVVWVRDNFHAADGEVSHVRDDFDRIGIFSCADEGNESAESRGDAGGSQILPELATGELLVVWISDESSPGPRTLSCH
jgi:hypothetical protein